MGLLVILGVDRYFLSDDAPPAAIWDDRPSEIDIMFVGCLPVIGSVYNGLGMRRFKVVVTGRFSYFER